MPENGLQLDLRYLQRPPLRTPSGDEFYYEQHGTKGPQLTFVNNFFLVAPMWRTFTQELVQHNRILTYDLRSQGASCGGSPDVKWTEHVEDLEALLDGFGIERTYLVGTSISALLCRDFAIAHPERVAGIVMAGPTCSPIGGYRRSAVTRSWINTLEAGGTKALWDHLYSMVFGEKTMQALGTPGYLGLREAFVSLHSVDSTLANLHSSLQASDDPDLLSQVGCPIRLVIGEDDFLWNTTSIGQAERLIRSGSTTVLPHTGHLPYMESTAGFEAAVQSFIDLVEPSPGGSR
jgi:3-oxoadipate enol-lactonase